MFSLEDVWDNFFSVSVCVCVSVRIGARVVLRFIIIYDRRK